MLGAKRLWSLLCMFGMIAFARATTVPELEQPVMDVAHILSETIHADLDGKIRDLYETNGTQIAVLTVPALENESIEDYSMRVASAWKLGQKGIDNGVLVTVAVKEHQVRIEVGYGLEGSLTDTKCGIIIRNCIIPQFKEDDYDGGITTGIDTIIGVINDDESINAQLEAWANARAPLTVFLIPLAMIGFFIGMVIFGTVQAKKRGGTVSASDDVDAEKREHNHHRYSADEEHGHSGRGGYSGGGGGFGGGGASGRW